jgi:hypothetical protein
MVCSKDSKLCFLNPRNMLLPMKQGQGVSTKVMMMGFNSSKVFQMVCSKWFQVVFSKPLKYACPWKGDHDVVQFLKDFTQRSEDHRNYITQNHWNHSNGHNMDLQAPSCQMQLQITWSSKHVAGDGAPCLQLWTELLASIWWHNIERRMHSCERARIPDAIAND